MQRDRLPVGQRLLQCDAHQRVVHRECEGLPIRSDALDLHERVVIGRSVDEGWGNAGALQLLLIFGVGPALEGIGHHVKVQLFECCAGAVGEAHRLSANNNIFCCVELG